MPDSKSKNWFLWILYYRRKFRNTVWTHIFNDLGTSLWVANASVILISINYVNKFKQIFQLTQPHKNLHRARSVVWMTFLVRHNVPLLSLHSILLFNYWSSSSWSHENSWQRLLTTVAWRQKKIARKINEMFQEMSYSKKNLNETIWWIIKKREWSSMLCL